MQRQRVIRWGSCAGVSVTAAPASPAASAATTCADAAPGAADAAAGGALGASSTYDQSQSACVSPSVKKMERGIYIYIYMLG